MVFPIPFRRVRLAGASILMFMSIPFAQAQADFSAFDRRADAGWSLTVVFLGGSLTWGAQSTDPQETSYRALTSMRLEARYPKARFGFGDAAIGGTGSQLAAFRLERDVLSKKPDLVFLDFTINDNPYGDPDEDRLAAYESLVRRLVGAGVPVVQVLLPAKKDVLPDPPERPLDAMHKAVGAAYGLPTADAVALARQRVSTGQTTADVLWDLPEDGTHPGDAGYALYAEAAWGAFERAVAGKMVCHAPERMLHADTYMTTTRARLTDFAALPEGWSVGKPHRNAIAYDFVCSRWMDTLGIAGAGAQPLRLKVRGWSVLLFGEQTQKSGSYRVRVDGGEPKTCQAKCADGNMRLVQLVATNLDAGREHDVEIIPVLAAGEELRLESICVAGAPASVEPRL